MNSLLVVTAIIQTVATIVVAFATVVYTQATVRILESQIDPSLDFDLMGDMNQNVLKIRNDARCAIDSLEVSVSIGHRRDGIPHPIRRCIYTEKWGKLKHGETVCTSTSLVTSETIKTDNMPNDITVDSSDLIMDYSFIRQADKRRFCFRHRIGVVRQSDGRFFYCLIGEPEKLSTTKQLIVQPIVDEQSDPPKSPIGREFES